MATKKTAKKTTKRAVTLHNTFRDMMDAAYKEKIFNSFTNMTLDAYNVTIDNSETVVIDVKYRLYEYNTYDLDLMTADINRFVHDFENFMGGKVELRNSMLCAERDFDDFDLILTLYMELKTGVRKKKLLDAHAEEMAREKAKRAEANRIKREKAKKQKEKKESEEYELFLKLKERYE